MALRWTRLRQADREWGSTVIFGHGKSSLVRLRRCTDGPPGSWLPASMSRSDTRQREWRFRNRRTEDSSLLGRIWSDRLGQTGHRQTWLAPASVRQAKPLQNSLLRNRLPQYQLWSIWLDEDQRSPTWPQSAWRSEESSL